MVLLQTTVRGAQRGGSRSPFTLDYVEEMRKDATGRPTLQVKYFNKKIIHQIVRLFPVGAHESAGTRDIEGDRCAGCVASQLFGAGRL